MMHQCIDVHTAELFLLPEYVGPPEEKTAHCVAWPQVCVCVAYVCVLRVCVCVCVCVCVHIIYIYCVSVSVSVSVSLCE